MGILMEKFLALPFWFSMKIVQQNHKSTQTMYEITEKMLTRSENHSPVLMSNMSAYIAEGVFL